MHYLGIDTAAGLAALTIVVGALATPAALPARPRARRRGRRRAPRRCSSSSSPPRCSTARPRPTRSSRRSASSPRLGLLARRPGEPGCSAPPPWPSPPSSPTRCSRSAPGRRWSAGAATGSAPPCGSAALCAAVLVALYVALDLVTGFDLIAAIRATDARYREGIAAPSSLRLLVLRLARRLRPDAGAGRLVRGALAGRQGGDRGRPRRW